MSDPQCKDASRFYFACKPDPDDCVWIERDLLEPVSIKKENTAFEESRSRIGMTRNTDDIENMEVLTFLYGEKPKKVSEAVAYFFENAHSGLPGEWTCSLNAAAFALDLRQTEEDKIWEAIERVAPEPLDDRDEYQVTKAIRDGYKRSI